MKEAGAVLGGGSAACALPRVQPDVMMITASRNEGGLAAVTLREFESQHATVKIQRTVEI